MFCADIICAPATQTDQCWVAKAKRQCKEQAMKCILVTSALVAAIGCYSTNAKAQDAVRQFHISKADQMLRLYENGELMEEFNVSTGKKGHETPSGIFSVIHKRKYHESNIYSNAPMPFMQRITWSGMALHEGNVPKYPASHGCIRIPKLWAQHLYSLAKPGTAVITTQLPIAPTIISHAFLPGQQKHALSHEIASINTKSAVTFTPASGATIDPMTTQSINEADAKNSHISQTKTKALKLLITWRDQRDKIRWSQMQLQSLGFDAGRADGISGPATKSAFAAFKRWKQLAPHITMLSNEAQSALTNSGFHPPLSNGVLRIRRDFKTAGDYDVVISDQSRELGTHFLQAIETASIDHPSQWTAITIPNQLGETTRQRLGLAPAQQGEISNIQSVFQRFSISQDARQFLEDNFTTHMSLTITDYSHERETGEGTEFITVTKDS